MWVTVVNILCHFSKTVVYLCCIYCTRHWMILKKKKKNIWRVCLHVSHHGWNLAFPIANKTILDESFHSFVHSFWSTYWILHEPNMVLRNMYRQGMEMYDLSVTHISRVEHKYCIKKMKILSRKLDFKTNWFTVERREKKHYNLLSLPPAIQDK